MMASPLQEIEHLSDSPLHADQNCPSHDAVSDVQLADLIDGHDWLNVSIRQAVPGQHVESLFDAGFRRPTDARSLS